MLFEGSSSGLAWSTLASSVVLHAGLVGILSGPSGTSARFDQAPAAEATAVEVDVESEAPLGHPREEMAAPPSPALAYPRHAARHDAPEVAHLAASAARGEPAGPAPSRPEGAIACADLGSPRFVLSLGAAAVSEGRASPENASAPGARGDGTAGMALSEEDVSVPARILERASPDYPAAARAQGVEADVTLAIVVDASGAVASAQLLRSAGFGFDQAALQAVRAYRFSPARRQGAPVAVRMRWSVSFRLR